MRQRYLKEHRPGLYSSLILSEKLYPHLLEIDRAACERMDAMLPRMMEAAGVTEELKARDPMRWVGLMNTLKTQVEEIIRLEILLFDGKCGGSYLRIYSLKKQNQMEYFRAIQSGTTRLAYDKIKSCEIRFRNFLGPQVSSP